MSYLKLPELDKMKGEVREIAENAVERWGYLPNLVKAYALAPEVIKAEDVWSKGIMYNGLLERELKEAIATVVSSTNKCNYCASSHAHAGTIAGDSKESTLACMNLSFSGFDDRKITALEFAQKATADPKSITKYDIDNLKPYYHSGEIVELVAVIQQFMGYNWFVTILGLELEPENPIRAAF